MIFDSSSYVLATIQVIGCCYEISLAVFPSYMADLFGVVSVSTLFGIAFFLSAGLFGASVQYYTDSSVIYRGPTI